VYDGTYSWAVDDSFRSPFSALLPKISFAISLRVSLVLSFYTSPLGSPWVAFFSFWMDLIPLLFSLVCVCRVFCFPGTPKKAWGIRLRRNDDDDDDGQ
jgi:hypothetical protein